jgi:hypothetical protein
MNIFGSEFISVILWQMDMTKMFGYTLTVGGHSAKLKHLSAFVRKIYVDMRSGKQRPLTRKNANLCSLSHGWQQHLTGPIYQFTECKNVL